MRCTDHDHRGPRPATCSPEVHDHQIQGGLLSPLDCTRFPRQPVLLEAPLVALPTHVQPAEPGQQRVLSVAVRMRSKFNRDLLLMELNKDNEAQGGAASLPPPHSPQSSC